MRTALIGRTHGCSDHCCTREETPANPEPSTYGESRGGISPPRAPKTVREPLDSHGFRCSASDIEEPPMSKEGWIGAANPGQPFSRSFGTFAQALELPARPADQVVIDAQQSRSQLHSIELAVVVD